MSLFIADLIRELDTAKALCAAVLKHIADDGVLYLMCLSTLFLKVMTFAIVVADALKVTASTMRVIAMTQKKKGRKKRRKKSESV